MGSGAGQDPRRRCQEGAGELNLPKRLRRTFSEKSSRKERKGAEEKALRRHLRRDLSEKNSRQERQGAKDAKGKRKGYRTPDYR